MTNWLADPTACVLRMKETAGQTGGSGCVILAGREEVLSRSTRVHRRVEGEGTKGERTIWSAGNIEVTRNGSDARVQYEEGREPANLRMTVWMNESQGSTTPALHPQVAILASDVLRAAAVNAGGAACGGQTILEGLWEELMAIMERLMTGQDAEDGKDPGRAEGVAYAIAVMQNPYRPSVDSVREQAMERWEEEQAKDQVAKAHEANMEKATRRRTRRARRSTNG